MVFPAYAAVQSASLEKAFYTDEESFTIVGVEDEGNQSVFVVIRGPSGDFINMVSDPSSDIDGVFTTIPRPVEDFFSSSGIYNATAFTGDEKEEDGFTFLLNFDGTKLSEKEDFVLSLRPISDQTITEGKTLSFTAAVTDSSIDKLIYSLQRNPPSGASIDESSGRFTWTPSASQGNAQGIQYTFDIVVESGAQRDSETITITVKDQVVEQPKEEPKEQPKEEPKEQPKEEPKDLGIASFVDPNKDPQSYVDRYNNEATYKAWFDENYPEYSSIYQAVGLKEVKEIAPFVDPNEDPQYYVDRYNNEARYQEWFDENFPEYDSIYEAVGLEEPKIKEPEIGECGPGTELIDGRCELVETTQQGGGCLIATAAFGSELAPQVQYLREIRDDKVMNTESGAFFMSGFNQFYYSFSPVIADYERENPVFKEAMKIGLTPLISSLSLMDFADSEEEVIGYGISLIILNLGMYIAAPAILVYKAKKFVKI
ncbi:MAG: Ig domain-containing protein [Nitrosopumilaceae archaeon]|nr:Ig domain-containing protein [Nitrosopumilaceae archaeon]